MISLGPAVLGFVVVVVLVLKVGLNACTGAEVGLNPPEVGLNPPEVGLNPPEVGLNPTTEAEVGPKPVPGADAGEDSGLNPRATSIRFENAVRTSSSYN